MTTAMQRMSILLSLFGCFLPGTFGLKIRKLTLPNNAVMGTPLWLSCEYDLEGDQLYSVKWYKGNQTFYRFLPDETPAGQSFHVHGTTVALHHSNDSHVFLSKSNRNTPDTYMCEVSSGFPDFDIIIKVVTAEGELRLREDDSHVNVHNSEIKRLRRHLFANYDTSVRPVHQAGDATTVKLSLNPMHILDMSDNHRIITMAADLKLEWHDEFLSWDPHHFEGIKYLPVEPSDIWLPDVSFWNTLPTKYGHGHLGINAQTQMRNILLSNGTVIKWEQHPLSFLCDPHKEDPKSHNCSLMMGCWGSDGTHINLEAGDINILYHVANPKWKISSHDITKMVFSFDPFEFPYVTATFHVKKQNATDAKSEEDH